MKLTKTLSLILALITIFTTTVISSTVTADAAFVSSDYAIWPAKNVNITQGPNGGYSHRGVNNFDVTTSDNNIIAPFDCKVVKIYKSYESGNSVVIQSKNKVHLANGSYNYVCMNCGHDNNINDLYIGKEIKQGQAFYQTGTYGRVNGRHCDIQVMIGSFSDKRANPFYAVNKYGNYYSPLSVSPEKVFFIKSGTKVNATAGLKFKTLETDISKATISVTANKVYTGKAITAASFVTGVTLNGVKLTSGTDYSVSISQSDLVPANLQSELKQNANIKQNTSVKSTTYSKGQAALIIGIYKLTITGKNGYKGSVSKTVNIIPGNVTLNSLSCKNKVITAKFSTVKGCKTLVKVTGSDGSSSTFTSSANGSCTIKTINGKALKKNVKYTVSVRAVADNADNTINKTCTTLYSAAWSASKSITVK